MFFKILFVTPFIICSGEPDPQKKSNRATYSQSFVREDVPLSYQYSAVHQYTPNRHVASEETETKNNFNEQLNSHSFKHKDIQYAPIPISRNHTYQTHPIRYTSVTPNPVPEYENYEKPEYSAVKKDHLEPKPVPMNANYIRPSTYKPNIMDNNNRYFQSLPNYYHTPINQVGATTETSKKELNELLKHFEIYQQIQQPKQQGNFVRHTPTESSKNDYYLHSGFSFLPKQELPQLTFENGKAFSIQTIPRLAYQNNFMSMSENLGKLPKYPGLNYGRIQPKTH